MVQTAVDHKGRVEDTLARVEEFMTGRTFGFEFVIDDYPISFNARGKCRLGIDISASRGVRTCKATTNKTGQWCQPKFSTYRDKLDTEILVMHPTATARAGWLFLSKHDGAWWTDASGPPTKVCDRAFTSPPRRVAIAYTFGGERKVMEADTRAEVEAWDIWVLGLEILARRAALAMKYHNGIFADVK